MSILDNFRKQPNEILRIGNDFTKEFASGDSIASATYTVKSGDTDVTMALTVAGSGKISDQNFDGVNDTASVQIISGDSGFTYGLSILATTLSGDVIEKDINIFVKSVN
jgi:hypothetical protein